MISRVARRAWGARHGARLPNGARRSRRDGFVLMAALWLLVALSAVGLDVAIRHRARRLAAANLLDVTRLDAAAMAGEEYARSRLSSAMLGRADELRAEATRVNRQQGRGTTTGGRGATTTTGRGSSSTSQMSNMFRNSDPGSDPWRDPSGLVPAQLVWNGITTTLVLRDPNAALNLNGASGTSLQQFFSLALRLDYALANKLAASILDWRDDDDIPQINGGEREEYVHDGLAMLPANHAFSSVDELRFVRGMTDEILAAAQPYLCVRANGSTVNINAAPEQVILSIPGMNQEGAVAIIRQRRSGFYPRSQEELRSILPSSTISSIIAARGAFQLPGVIYTTDQVEIIASTSVPGTPSHATTDIIVARAINGAAVTWRRDQ